MTGLLARVSRWLMHREPLWLVTGAGALLDVATYVVPAVPDAWHGWVNAVVVVLTLLSGRAIVFSPDTMAKILAQIRPIPPGTTTGGTVTTISPLMPTGPAGPSDVRRVPPEQSTPTAGGPTA